MVVLDTQSGKEVARLRAAGECDDVFFDASRKRIYVIGGEGIISVFQQNDPDHYELVAAALSSDPVRSRAAALDLHIAPDRAYGSYTDMARAEAARPDRIEVVAIVTPNNLHYPMAKAFLEAGFHVICDKPLTTTVQEALDLAAIVRRTDLIFGLTHNYTGYPMVRQARQMIADGQLGKIRLVQVEYAQDWLATPVEQTGQICEAGGAVVQSAQKWNCAPRKMTPRSNAKMRMR